MRLRPGHLVLAVAAVAVLGVLLVLVAHLVPNAKEGVGSPDTDRVAGASARGAEGLRPSLRRRDAFDTRGQDARDTTNHAAAATGRALPQPLDDPASSSPSSSPAPRSPGTTPLHRYQVVRTYPHDRRCFTQGLVYEDGFLYEGTGLHGQSALYKRELETGKIVKTLRLPEKYFGEGITLFGDRLIQLTWQSNVGFVYRKDTFTPLREFPYPGEGWGLTHDGQRLILSDGTATLRFLDPNTYAETGRLEVRDQGRPVQSLNELEYIDGRVYANVWPTYQIVVIDPQTGRVTGRIDLSGLYTPPAAEQEDSVLNGIAYLPQTRHLLVTGKLWPRMYEIELLSESPRQ